MPSNYVSTDTIYGLTRDAWRLIAAFDHREAVENDQLGIATPPKKEQSQ